MRKQVLINVEATDIRVAILEDGTLVELFVEDVKSRSKVGNIYKGRVEGIVPGLKAVFVNIGAEKNAFLHFSDVLPEFELPQRGRPERERRPPLPIEEMDEDEDESTEAVGEDDEYVDPLTADEDEVQVALPPRPPRRSRPLQVGEEIIVQATKEEISTKGARITTYVSLPGRFLVLMPFSEQGGGVSRRIEDANERRRLRRILSEIQPETGSFIIRTAGLDQDEAAIRQDAELLQKRWHAIVQRASRVHAPASAYDEQEILTRVVRDSFSDDLDEILVDSKPAMRQLIRTCQEMIPSLCNRIHYYDSAVNIFDTFEVEKQFQKALRRKVWLRSGGAIIIDETEAMTAVDVNSGKYVGHEDQDQVILKTNLEACRAIARQLRLRDLGGLIVIDFIDMSTREHELQVLREYKRCLRHDRAKYSISDFSEFGLVQMTRKRVKKSLASSLYRPCPYCEGSGRILSEPQLWKQLKYDLIAELEAPPKATSVDIMVHSQLKTYMQENILEALGWLANKYQVSLNIISCNDYHHEQIKIVKHVKSTSDNRGNRQSSGHSRDRRSAEKKLESAQRAQDNAS